MDWIIGLLVFICGTLIFGVIYLRQAITETNQTIADHLHGISHMVTAIEQGVNAPKQIAVGQKEIDKRND